MIDTQIKFCSFNMGQGRTDHTLMLGFGRQLEIQREREWTRVMENFAKTPNLNEEQHEVIRNALKLIPTEGYETYIKQSNILAPLLTQKVFDRAVDELQDELEESVALRLVDRDIICLQEVARRNRSFIKTLEANGFVLHKVEERGRFSTAIAVKAEKFKEIRNISIKTNSYDDRAIYGKDVAAVAVVPKTTLDQSIQLVFSSLHCWGFALTDPRIPSNERNYTKEDLDRMRYADAYIGEAIANTEGQGVTYSVMAGDMNNNPGNYRKTFDIVNKHNFSVLRSNFPTNINNSEPEYKLREIDFIFAQQLSTWQKICRAVASIFLATIKIEMTQPSIPENFEFSMNGNCSDHMPIFSTLNVYQPQASVLSRIWQSIRGCFFKNSLQHART